ncbi:MAG: hypothetical protein HY722_10690 [Planctomycetes bacterium]|nr:hypothetical protein [Planctomycetota bacterium]
MVVGSPVQLAAERALRAASREVASAELARRVPGRVRVLDRSRFAELIAQAVARALEPYADRFSPAERKALQEAAASAAPAGRAARASPRPDRDLAGTDARVGFTTTGVLDEQRVGVLDLVFRQNLELQRPAGTRRGRARRTDAA